MDTSLTQADLELVEAARDVIRRRYVRHTHKVGAALRTVSGRVITGVHIEATVGRMGVCAEAIALGRAATEFGDTRHRHHRRGHLPARRVPGR